MLAIDTSVLPAKRLRISEYNPESNMKIRTWESDNSGIFQHIPSRRLDTLLVIDAVISNTTGVMINATASKKKKEGDSRE
jgi:hypothetical protein